MRGIADTSSRGQMNVGRSDRTESSEKQANESESLRILRLRRERRHTPLELPLNYQFDGPLRVNSLVTKCNLRGVCAHSYCHPGNGSSVSRFKRRGCMSISVATERFVELRVVYNGQAREYRANVHMPLRPIFQ